MVLVLPKEEEKANTDYTDYGITRTKKTRERILPGGFSILDLRLRDAGAPLAWKSKIENQKSKTVDRPRRLEFPKTGLDLSAGCAVG